MFGVRCGLHGALLFPLLLLSVSARGWAEPETKLAPDGVQMKSGTVFQGRVVGVVALDGRSYSEIESDYGRILVPATDVVSNGAVRPPGYPFHPREVRIVRLQGNVQRRGFGEETWSTVTESQAYAHEAPARILPGDTVRTATGAVLEILLHRNAWVRMEAESEITLARWGAKHSLSLLRGRIQADVDAKSLRRPFLVRTATVMLGVRGTRFSIGQEGGLEHVHVLRGRVDVGQRGVVEGGMAAALGGVGPLTLRPLTQVEARVLEAPRAERPADDLVYVPGGIYTIGLEPERVPRMPRLTPQSGTNLVGTVSVNLRPFLIDRNEVTARHWSAFLSARGGAPAPLPLDGIAADRPAQGMTYTEAEAFARWLGKGLPTATQWHVAALGNSGAYYPWGDDMTYAHASLATGTYIIEADEGRWIAPPDLPPVTAPTLDVSPFGVRSMVSGVFEWVRTPLSTDPLWRLISERTKGHFRSAEQPAMQGWGHSALYPSDVGHNFPGIRCVVEL